MDALPVRALSLRRRSPARRQAGLHLADFADVDRSASASGVMALIIALALMTGLQGELRDRILGSTAHVYVYKAGGLTDVDADMKRLQVPRVLGAAPVMLGKAMIATGQTTASSR